MSHGYYEILEVSPDASPEVIKKAYFAGIRKHSPEKDPTGNQKVREAYEVLKDPGRRKEYDAQSQYGEELSRLWDLAREYHESKNFQEETKTLKKILIISEDNTQARVMLSLSYLHEGMFTDAIKVAQGLAKRKSEESLSWFNLGFVFEMSAGRFPSDNEKKANALNEARKNYNKAIQLNPGDHQYYIAISRCFAEEGKWINAFLWADKAIGSHKKSNSKWPDIEALFYPLDLCLKSGKFDKVFDFAKNIQGNIPDEKDIMFYVSKRFFDYGKDLYNSNDFKGAFYFFKSALLFNPDNEELDRFCKFLNSAKNAIDEVEAFKNDEGVIFPIRVIVSLCRDMAFQIKTYEEVETQIEKACKALGDFEGHLIQDSIEIIQSDYPGHWLLSKDVLLKFKETARKNNSQGQRFDNNPAIEKKNNYFWRVTAFGCLASFAYFNSWSLICSGSFAIGFIVNLYLFINQFGGDDNN